MTDRPRTRSTTATWRPPTRRMFVQMLAAAAAVVALRDQAEARPPALWIGHC